MDIGKHRKTKDGILAVEIPGEGSVHMMDLGSYMKDNMATLFEGLGKFDPIAATTEWEKYCKSVTLDGEDAELATVPLSHRAGAFMEMFAAGVGTSGPFSPRTSLTEPASESAGGLDVQGPKEKATVNSEPSEATAVTGASTPKSQG